MALLPDRICVVGNSGSGKTHLARRLAATLGVPHVELDAIHHLPGWTEAPTEQFVAEVTAVLARSPGWVVDGNYRSKLDGVVHPDLFVWLDYPRWVVAPRVVRRSLRRAVLRQELWNGNRERWRALLSRDPETNIVLWSITQHAGYRRRYEAAMAGSPAAWVRLRTPRKTERWLADLQTP